MVSSCWICVHLNFHLIYVILVKIANVCDRLRQILRQQFITAINFCTSFQEVGSFILVIASIFLSMCLTPSRVTRRPKYSISVCAKNDFSILHLSHFPFSLIIVNYSLCKWSIRSTFVKNKRLSMYAWMNPHPWNK